MKLRKVQIGRARAWIGENGPGAVLLGSLCMFLPLLHAQSPASQQSKTAQPRAPEPLGIAQASRVDKAPRMDGILDDPLWKQATPIVNFLQREPYEGQTPTEQTEVRILFTKREVYFGITCFDSNPKGIITDIATSAGFQSVRQFNHAIHSTYEQSPRRLRSQAGGTGASSKASGLSIRLSYRPPFDWASILKFLRSHAIPGVESLDEDSYRRTIEIEGVYGELDVQHDPAQTRLIARVRLPRYEGLMSVGDRVRRIFDLRADPMQISNHLRRDQYLEPLLDAHPGLRVPGAWDGFESCVCAILGHSIGTGGTNRRLIRRFVETFGRPGVFSVHGLTHLFPRPHEFSIAELSSIGIRDDRAVAIRALSRSVNKKTLTFEASRSLEESLARLLTIPGIDRTTAEYVALRVFGEPDAFPVKPSALKGFFSQSIGTLPEGDGLQTSDQWRPWRAYAAMYLTSSFDHQQSI
jgi:AraC family transcriptional regulator of adaptative response / DNA-3-methyladenine glycosylase II